MCWFVCLKIILRQNGGLDPDWGSEWGRSSDGCIDGGPRASRGREVSGFFCPIGLNGVFFNRNVFDSCMKSFQYFRMDNMSLEMSVHWLYEYVVSFKIEVGVYEKFAKM